LSKPAEMMRVHNDNRIPKKKKALFLWAAASFVCMLLIFLASSQTADESSELSGGLTRLIFGTMWRWFAPDGQDMPVPLFVALETVLRKAAHVLAFFALGVCAANTVRQVVVRRGRVFVVSLLWCAAYGALDELHQHFVPGRAMMWQDWVIDTVGALVGVGVVLLVHRRAGKRSNTQS